MIPILYNNLFTVNYGALNEALECIVIEERNGMFEAELKYSVNSPNWDKLVRGNIVVADANDTLKSQKFRIYKVSKTINNTFKVYAKHISYDLLRDYIESINIENQSCEYALNTIFRTSQFSQKFKGYSDIISAQNFKVNNVNPLQAIAGVKGSIIDTYGTGAEILRDNENIHVLNKRGHDNGVTIEYAKNLTGLDMIENDDSELITRIKPIAKISDDNGERIIGSNPKYVDSPRINDYETPYIKEIDFSDKFEEGQIATPDKLKTLAEKYYEETKCDIPKSSLKINFIPLSKCVGYEGLEDKISLCDTVTIKDKRYSIETKAKVIKATYNTLKERYEGMEIGEPRTSLGSVLGGSTSQKGEKGDKGDKGDPGADGNIGDFPDSLPTTPTLSYKLYGFSNIELNWTFENKIYYQYELYASKIKNFTPNTFDLIHQGASSSFLFQAKPNETWYFRVCAINSHGRRSAFSSQVTVTTTKINDLSNYVSNMAIGDALIGTLNLDRGWYGELRGNYIDAKQLSVTDGNGKRTLDIDSFGNVYLDVNSLNIQSKGVATREEVTKALDDAKSYADLLEEDLHGQIDQKIETWYQDTDPSYNWETVEEKNKHRGDIWYYISNKATFRWSGSSWNKFEEAEELAKSKATIFTKKPNSYNANDLWILENDAIHSAGKTGDVLTATTAATTYNANHWVKKISYTDDSYVKSVESAINQKAEEIKLSVKSIEKLTGEYILDEAKTLVKANWSTISGITVSTNTTQKTINIYTTSTINSTTGEYGASIESECLANTEYTLNFKIYPYSTTNKFYRIRVQLYDGTNWTTIKEFTGETTGTKDNREEFSYAFKTLSSTAKMRLWIGREQLEKFDICISDISVFKMGEFARGSSLKLLEDKIATKVDVDGVKSTIEQSPNSVMMGFNEISDVVYIDKTGMKLRGIFEAKINETLYARLQPIEKNGEVQFRMTLAGSGINSNFNIIDATNKELFRVGHGGIGLHNNITFTTDDTGSYSGMCYWENGTYYPANDWKNIIGKNSNAFYKVFGYKFGLDRTGAERYADFEGPIFRLISSWGYGGIVGDMQGYFFPEQTNAWSFGKSDKRISTVYTTNINQPSDARLKENIKYLLKNEAKAIPEYDEEKEISNITTNDLYEFVRDDLNLAEFNYILPDGKASEKVDTIGFIAQDIVGSKIGDKLLTKDEKGTLSYDNATYISILGGALQKAIEKIEILEDRIKELENK